MKTISDKNLEIIKKVIDEIPKITDRKKKLVELGFSISEVNNLPATVKTGDSNKGLTTTLVNIGGTFGGKAKVCVVMSNT